MEFPNSTLCLPIWMAKGTHKLIHHIHVRMGPGDLGLLHVAASNRPPGLADMAESNSSAFIVCDLWQWCHPS